MILAPFIEINQPIGTFYITKLSPENIIMCTEVKRRINHSEGIQRALDRNRVAEISNYCSDPDATFPTPIIIAVDSAKVEIENNYIKFYSSEKIGEIIDGQHRIEGFKKVKNKDKFELPVIFMFDLTAEEKAYVFSVINSNQKPVPKSLIYDLFDLSSKRSPFKTAHEIARGLNVDEQSSFYGRLKMLGKKETSNSSLSQGTFVHHLLRLMSRKPEKDTIDLKNERILCDDDKLPLRYYFIHQDDEVIYIIIRNYFNAVSRVFIKEWNNSDEYILSRSTGYGALMRVFPVVYHIGDTNDDLSEEFFFNIFMQIKNKFYENYSFTSEEFASNEQEQNRLAKIILKLIKESQ